MTIQAYRDDPFDPNTAIGLNDLFIGDGIETSFTLVNKTGIELGGTIQADTTSFLKYNGGYTLSGDTFTLSSAPGVSSVIVAPSYNVLSMSAFDVPVVSGLTDPQVQEVAFYIGNGQDIYLEYYTGLTGEPGIKLEFVNLIDLAGLPDESWVQLASSTQDEAGDPDTYQVTGQPLYTFPIMAFGLVTSTVTSLSTEFLVTSSDTWYTGDYILINPGQPNSEIVKLIGQTGDPITEMETTPLNYDHDPGESVFACVRKFWAKLTVPEATVTPPVNFLNVSLNITGKSFSRF